MATRSERGAARVLEKLEISINSGQYYEAHQMYRTLYFRYLSQEKYVDLLNLLYKGSILLLEHDQQESGADLALLVIEVLVKSDTKPCEEWMEKAAKLFEIMSSNIPERELFLTNAVKWSMDANKKGHAFLHKKIAEVYWLERKYTAAHRHFLHSSDGAAYATMLIELHTTKGLESEIDLFIVQAVLQFLCLHNIGMANDTFKNYTKNHPSIKNERGPPYLVPLLNFLWFLLRAVEQTNVPQFQILRKCYEENLKRDPNYSGYLDKIGAIWFGIRVMKNNRLGNPMIGGFLKSIIGDVDSSDDEGGNDRNQVASVPELD